MIPMPITEIDWNAIQEVDPVVSDIIPASVT